MAKYIDKSALVADIERRIKINKECMLGFRNLDYYQGKVDALNDTISFINTLEVKEVDLEKEWKEFLKDGDVGFKEIAKHFFELGMRFQTETNITLKYNIGESVREYKAQKGE